MLGPQAQAEPASAVPLAKNGYTAGSPQVRQLLATMEAFSRPERRLFLRFVTGSPRLPIGGFGALSPPLTVVKAVPSQPGARADDLLPTCSTCQVFLKLPAYSGPAVLREKLLLAIHEGQGIFDFD